MINKLNTKTQIKKISVYIDELNRTRNKMTTLKLQINSSWKSEEVRYITNALDEVNSQILQATKLMQTLRFDVLKALEKIEKEEVNKKQ